MGLSSDEEDQEGRLAATGNMAFPFAPAGELEDAVPGASVGTEPTPTARHASPTTDRASRTETTQNAGRLSSAVHTNIRRRILSTLKEHSLSAWKSARAVQAMAWERGGERRRAGPRTVAACPAQGLGAPPRPLAGCVPAGAGP